MGSKQSWTAFFQQLVQFVQDLDFSICDVGGYVAQLLRTLELDLCQFCKT